MICVQGCEFTDYTSPTGYYQVVGLVVSMISVYGCELANYESPTSC